MIFVQKTPFPPLKKYLSGRGPHMLFDDLRTQPRLSFFYGEKPFQESLLHRSAFGESVGFPAPAGSTVCMQPHQYNIYGYGC